MPARTRGRPGDAQRVLQKLTIGVTQARERRDATARQLGMRELEQQFQFPISGQAGTTIAWDSMGCDFDYPFYFAPGQRDSDLEVPHMTYGVVLEGGTPVAIVACVTGWKRDNTDDSYTGATVAVGAFSPGASAPIQYGGAIHISFQGYGALLEDETEMSL